MTTTSPEILELENVLTCDFELGKLFWKKKVASKVVVGQEAGSTRADGYKLIQVNKRRYLVHQVIFALKHKYFAKELDHINGNPFDNRVENLRAVNRHENNYNRRTPSHNTSGIKGVFMQKRGKTWSARLTTKSKLFRVGGFATKELAFEFLTLWRELAHGVYANTGTKAY
jgi:hypothetical protein